VAAAGYPYHVTEPGKRCHHSLPFSDGDPSGALLPDASWLRQARAEVRPYCLVRHKGHLIVVPHATNGLLRAIGEIHRRFVRRISHRGRLWGHLWEEFRPSFLLDESQLVAAARYLESHHGSWWLCSHPESWPRSGVGSYLSGEDGLMVGVAPMVDLFANWRSCLYSTKAADESLAE
jgi:hypothetical protein